MSLKQRIRLATTIISILATIAFVVMLLGEIVDNENLAIRLGILIVSILTIGWVFVLEKVTEDE